MTKSTSKTVRDILIIICIIVVAVVIREWLVNQRTPGYVLETGNNEGLASHDSHDHGGGNMGGASMAGHGVEIFGTGDDSRLDMYRCIWLRLY